MKVSKTKKTVRFIIALLVSPIYIPATAASVVITSILEILSDDSDLDCLWQHHINENLKWYMPWK